MNIITKEFKRKARRNWCCDQCNNVILAGDTYKDKEIHYITSEAKDWQGSKYHWKICLWTTDGDLLKTSNVRFV